jgi:hypothetical protein
MPHVQVVYGPRENPIYQVGGKSFVFFRTPQRDAFDASTGERYLDVVMLWVANEADKLSLLQDRSAPFFTTPRFDGHLSVLLRLAHVDRLTYAELAELVQDAWLARASARRAGEWLRSQDFG